MSEPTLPFSNSGWIEVIVGSMYSGKTRGADPPPAPRPDRAPEGRDLQARHRRPLRARPHRLAQRAAHPLARGHDRARTCCATPHEAQVIGIDEGQFLGPDAGQRSCERLAAARQARDRRRARPGLPRQAVRAHAAAARHRRVHHQDARHLRRVRHARQPHATARAPRAAACVVGGADLYEARCRRCFELGRRAGAARRADRHPEVPMRLRPLRRVLPRSPSLVLVAGCARRG